MAGEFKNLKRFWFVVVGLYFTVGYLTINHFNQFRSSYFNVELGFEKNIPYIPVFVLGYLLVYFSMFLLYFLIEDRDVFKRAIVLYLSITTVFYVFFLLFPVEMGLRPDLSNNAGLFNFLAKLYYFIDLPYNCFPSLHVAYPFLGVLVLWSYRRGWSYLYMLMTLVIAISVVIVKQHYILDVVVAPVAVGITYIIVLRLYNPVKNSCRIEVGTCRT